MTAKRSRIVAWCVSGILLASLASLAAAQGPIEVGRSDAQMPAWATRQIEVGLKGNKMAEALLDKFIDPQTGKYPFGWNAGQADDAVEGVSTWDRYALLYGSDKVRAGMVRLWGYVYRKLAETKAFKDGFYAFPYDAEHMGELFQMLWACQELDPFNAELADQNRKVADAIIDRCYDPKSRLLKHVRFDGTGVERNPNRPNPRRDEILNGLFIMSAFRAYMTTGDEKYRRWALEYGGKWNEMAAGNNGILPYCADSVTGRPTQKWWRGVSKWDYERQGFGLAARWLHGWPVAMVLMDKGNPAHLKGLTTTLDSIFAVRPDGLPVCFHDGTGWLSSPGSKLGDRSGNVGCFPKVADRPYSMAFHPAAGERLRKYYKAALGPTGDVNERRFLSLMMFIYFDEFDLNWAGEQLQFDVERATKRVERVAARTRPPGSGDELTELALFRPPGMTLVDGAFYGMYDNGRAGCPSTAPVGYWRNEKSRGLPAGVAALVRHVGPDGVRLLLANTNDTPTKLWLIGGFYGTHRIDSVEDVSAKRLHKPGKRAVEVTLPAKGLAELKVTMTRYLYRPTLTPVATPPAAW